MSSFSVAEAENNLSDLIDRALKGEGVVITRHGTPVIEFRPILAPVKPITTLDLEWLATRCLSIQTPPTLEGGTLIDTMRDEDEH